MSYRAGGSRGGGSNDCPADLAEAFQETDARFATVSEAETTQFVYLDCDEDSPDCTSEDGYCSFAPGCSIGTSAPTATPPSECDDTRTSGGQGTTTFDVIMGASQGTFQLTYDMFSVPDSLTASYDGVEIYTTGGLVSNGRTVTLGYGSAASTSEVITIVVFAPTTGTAWEVAVSCPFNGNPTIRPTPLPPTFVPPTPAPNTFPTSLPPTSSTLPPTSMSFPPTPMDIPEVNCGIILNGGLGTTMYMIIMGDTSGEFLMEYSFGNALRSLSFFYDGDEIYATPGPVTGDARATVEYGSSTSSSNSVTMMVTASEGLATLWSVGVSCPLQPTPSPTAEPTTTAPTITESPSLAPTESPSLSLFPSPAPSALPSETPTVTSKPTAAPTSF